MNSDRIWTLFARKLAEESSPEELVELEVLLKEDPHAHLKIQVLEESWNKIDNPDKHEPETEYQRLTQKLKEQGFNIPITDDTENINGIPVVVNRFKKITGLIAALVFIVAAGLGTIFILNNGESKVNSSFVTNSINAISTKYGSRSKVELPDGSVVWLNSGSKLTYGKQFGASLREVNLSGEGFFDVVHNAGKPFIIHTAFFDIKDLGTRFNVKCYQEDKTTETSLIEGSVEVTLKKNPTKKYVLTPDYKLVLLNEDIKAESVKVLSEKKINHLPVEPVVAIKKLTYQAEDSFAVETAWQHDKLSFDDEAFSEVAKKMERWFDRKIEFRNKKLEDVHLTVSFINESFEQAIDALKYTNRFNYEIKEGKAIIY